MKILAELFGVFFKVGLFTFGGGYAMLPLLKAELVDRKHWVGEDELLDYFSIGQCTPGIIAINVATFCGYKLKKITGGVTATLAMICPSLIIITLVAACLNKMMDHEVVKSAFAGVRLGVSALLVNLIYEMGVKIYRQSARKILHGVIFLCAVALLFGLGAPAVTVVVLSAVAGFPFWKKGTRK